MVHTNGAALRLLNSPHFQLTEVAADTEPFHPESVLSNTYQKPPMIPPPAIPRPRGRKDPLCVNIDINGHPFGLLSPEPPLVPGIFEVLCEAALLQYAVMTYNSGVRAGRIGSIDDMEARGDLFSKIAFLEDSLCARMRYRVNATPQTLYLKWVAPAKCFLELQHGSLSGGRGDIPS